MENGLSNTPLPPTGAPPQTQAASPGDETPKVDLATYKRMFEEAQYSTTEARKENVIDDDYFHARQWTSDERRTLRDRRQPDSVFNMVRKAVEGTIGVIRQNATDPKAYPRKPQDEDIADVASKTLRFIADRANFKALKVDCAQDFLVQGTCAAIVELDADRQITVEQIRWEEFFYDPRARRKDLRDARYVGVAKWMFADDVAALYPDQASDINNTVAAGQPATVSDLSFSDRPNTIAPLAWVDTGKRRVMVVEIYHREQGKWLRCVFHAGGILEAGLSQYLDEKGRPMCPIEAQSCYVNRDNQRYGIVADMRSPQDEINKRHSKLLHLLNSHQLQETSPGSGMGDISEARKEAAKPDGVIPPGWTIVRNDSIIAGQVQLLQEAKQFMDRFAPNPAIVGRAAPESSGRAQLLRQQSGLTELAMVYGGVEDWEVRIYRQMWARAQQFWTAPAWVRVTDDEGKPSFVGVNMPKGPPVLDPQTGQPAMNDNGEPIEGPPVMNEQGAPIDGYRNQLGQLDVDIVVDTMPSTANVQQEQFQILADLAGKMPNSGVSFDDLLKLSAIPNKKAILDEREQRAKQGPPPLSPLDIAKIKNLDSETELNLTNAFQNLAAAIMAGKLVPDMAPPVQMAPQPGMGAPGLPGPPQSQPAPLAGPPPGPPQVQPTMAA